VQLAGAGVLCGSVGVLYLIAYLWPEANWITRAIHRSVARMPEVSRLPVLLVALVLLIGSACLLNAAASVD
jgi:hypothetical protein